jgi:DNA-directed RNA polymerase
MKELGIGLSPEGKFKQKLTNKLHNGLRCYEIIDGDITRVSIVKNPAHSYKGKIVSEEERTFMAPILVPDKMIYRINPITGEQYYIYFTAEVIEKITTKYRKENWTDEELVTLVRMYSDCNTIKEIAFSVNREEEDVVYKIENSGESFVHLILALMISKNKEMQEITKLLKMSEAEVLNLVTQMGGKIIKK